jgi:hypothetical protein
LRLTLQPWRAVLWWFVRGVPSAQIANETRLDRKRVLRALTVVRRAMMRSVPAGARRLAETDIPPVSRRRTRDLHAGPEEFTDSPRRRFATLGLYTAHGHEWAEVIPESDVEQLERMLDEKRGGQSSASPDFHPYTAVVYRGRLHRLTESAAGRPSIPFGQIEAFWAYLQRQLSARGGIRRERLGLYLAEYAWRYNHRHLSSAEKLRELLKLIRQHPVRWKQ